MRVQQEPSLRLNGRETTDVSLVRVSPITTIMPASEYLEGLFVTLDKSAISAFDEAISSHSLETKEATGI